MNSFAVIKRIPFIAFLFLFIDGLSQTLYAPKIQSPNAAGLGTFGEVPVNLFTGTPNISIPIYNLNYGKINLPINLRYNSAAVKPGLQPGWVGSGWDLESMGTISRQVRGLNDEAYLLPGEASTLGLVFNPTPPNTQPNIIPYYPYPGQPTNVEAGAYWSNIPDWNSTVSLTYMLQGEMYNPGGYGRALILDHEADEFSFDVFGHSGKFYYEGQVKGWQVVSDEAITLQLTGFLSPDNIVNTINTYTYPQPPVDNGHPLITSNGQSRMFGGFILTVPDGTKFYFGDTNNSGTCDGVEFSSAFTTSTTPNPEFTANTWLLKKIVDANNNEVDFNYERKSPTCNLTIGFFEVSSVSSVQPPFGFWGAVPSTAWVTNSYVDPSQRSGIFQWPMYLTSINTPNETVKFTSTEASCLRYSDNQIKTYTGGPNGGTGGDYTENMTLNRNPSYIKWKKLDNVTITDNVKTSTINSGNPNIIRQFQFNYNNSPNERLELKSLQELDNAGNATGQFVFTYKESDKLNLNGTTTIYPDGNFSDHWGFYNGVDISLARSADIFDRKKPSQTLCTAGLLKSITYPTGGQTNFTWESNEYSKVVDSSRQFYNYISGYGGGARIAEIRSFLQDGSTATVKKYIYRGGTLNGMPKYQFELNNRPGLYNNVNYSFKTTSLFGTGNYSYTGQGSPIGYDEVDEINQDGSYTEIYFTNYGPDLNGVSHWDKPPTGFIGWKAGDTYFPMSSLEKERGKIIEQREYASNHTLLQKTNYTYRNDAARFENSLNFIDINPNAFKSNNTFDFLILVSARSIYNYSYYPISKTITVYDQNGKNPITNISQYTYNSKNLIKNKIETNSKGETIITSYTYPTDYTITPPYPSMVAANIVNPIVQTEITNNTRPTLLTLRNFSNPSTGIYVSQNLQMKVSGNAIETREQVNSFDIHGNIREVQKPDGVKEVYLWGCNSQYLMAKIVGSNYAEVNTAASAINSQYQAMLDNAANGTSAVSDNTLQTFFASLRSSLLGINSSIAVTSYTYACGLGITSVTDQQGRTDYYTYDGFGRLSYIQDKDKNVLKRFSYAYGSTSPTVMNPYSNDAISGTFTKVPACPTGLITPTYTYIVPAGKYTSVDPNLPNTQAQQELATNGQATANALPCLAAVSVTVATQATPPPPQNGSTQPPQWVVALTNTQSGVTYANDNVYSGTQLNVPLGNYTVTATPVGFGGNYNLIINGVTYPCSSLSNISVTVNSAASITITNTSCAPPPSGPCTVNAITSAGFATISAGGGCSAGVASGGVVFYSIQSQIYSGGNSYPIAAITGICLPSGTRTTTVLYAGRTWVVTIAPSGVISVQMTSGNPLPAGEPVVINFTYNL